MSSLAAGIVDLGQRLSGLMVEGTLFLYNNAAVVQTLTLNPKP